MLSEKKKRSDLGLHIFLPKSGCSLKKKKYLHFNFNSDFPIFLPKSRSSPKKKRKKGLHFDFISDFPIFLPKLWCPPKKKKKKKRSLLGISLGFFNFPPNAKIPDISILFRTFEFFHRNYGRYGNPNLEMHGATV